MAADLSRPVSNAELATFIFMLFRVHDAHGQPRGSFKDQLDALRKPAPQHGFELPADLSAVMNPLFLNIDSVLGDPQTEQMLNDAHQALRTLFETMVAKGFWAECSTVDLNRQIFGIARL